MSRGLRSLIIWSIAAAVCILLLTFSSFAASAVDPSALSLVQSGPGSYDTVINEDNTIGTISDFPDGEDEVIINYTSEESEEGTVYIFEGSRYLAGAYCGIYRLTGYSSEETGYSGTASGTRARSGHTMAAGSDFPLGTVLIVKGTSGPYCSDFDGMYVVEDRGGEILEEEQFLDIYFDTYAEAARTSEAGWNYAEAWIAELIE